MFYKQISLNMILQKEGNVGQTTNAGNFRVRPYVVGSVLLNETKVG
jgi:hypothetical protein